MSYSMFLDDIRDPEKYYPNQNMVLCRDYESACAYVNEHGLPQFISFDHDLGDVGEDEKTGYSFAKFLIDYMVENNISTGFDYIIHSSNPVGKVNIDTYLQNGFRFLRGDN
ncbi:cyclic-phosphate processing receiver domain-containing protein [Escherichia coli]|nr:cyclic-phosphate processing receiver domain-containing protein [Escherichia coli O157]